MYNQNINFSKNIKLFTPPGLHRLNVYVILHKKYYQQKSISVFYFNTIM